MQGTFRGEKRQRFDAKGRVSIPSTFRKVLDAGDPDRDSGEDPNLIIVHGDKGRKFLEGFTQVAHDRKAAQIARMKGEPKRMFTRLFLMQSSDMRVDSTGRIVLPKELRDKLGLGESGELVFAGAGETFQIWNAETYDAEMGEPDITALDGVEEGMDMNDAFELFAED